jgi:hypothetical protein
VPWLANSLPDACTRIPRHKFERRQLLANAAIAASNNVITIDDERIKSHLDRVLRGTVEETLNALLDAEADRLCNAVHFDNLQQTALVHARPDWCVCYGLTAQAGQRMPA